MIMKLISVILTNKSIILQLYGCLLIINFITGCGMSNLFQPIAKTTPINNQKPAPPQGENLLETMTVDGLTRTALVSPGHTTVNPPLVFVFHGFGGYASSMESLTKIHQLWPEATVVYPQGLDVVKPSIQYWAPGWPDYPDEYKTANAINQYHDRDIHFIDELLLLMRTKYQIDSNRVYATGFSNGATFSYLLYTQRPTLFAAFAGLAGPATFLNYAYVSRPLLTINGTNDAYVPANLAATMKSEFMRVNQCSNTATSWQFNSAYSIYQPAIPAGEPLIWYQPNSGHTWIAGASEAIVAFFKEH
jgi:polyhydroxybutyrate depolymerase